LAEFRNKKFVRIDKGKGEENGVKKGKREKMGEGANSIEQFHVVEDGGCSNVSHLVVTTTGFVLPLDSLSSSRVSTHFCTLFP